RFLHCVATSPPDLASSRNPCRGGFFALCAGPARFRVDDHGAGFQTKHAPRRVRIGVLVALAGTAWPQFATAAPGDPVEIGGGATLDPILAARLRHESVDQAGMPEDAEALTLRGRAGAELAIDGFSFLAEAEGTLALTGDYNDTLPDNGLELFPVVAD